DSGTFVLDISGEIPLSLEERADTPVEDEPLLAPTQDTPRATYNAEITSGSFLQAEETGKHGSFIKEQGQSELNILSRQSGDVDMAITAVPVSSPKDENEGKVTFENDYNVVELEHNSTRSVSLSQIEDGDKDTRPGIITKENGSGQQKAQQQQQPKELRSSLWNDHKTSICTTHRSSDPNARQKGHTSSLTVSLRKSSGHRSDGRKSDKPNKRRKMSTGSDHKDKDRDRDVQRFYKDKERNGRDSEKDKDKDREKSKDKERLDKDTDCREREIRKDHKDHKDGRKQRQSISSSSSSRHHHHHHYHYHDSRKEADRNRRRNRDDDRD
ncbi:hypothetical protein BIW11_08348, partial [Tropilaelaps mercedesae]